MVSILKNRVKRHENLVPDDIGIANVGSSKRNIHFKESRTWLVILNFMNKTNEFVTSI